MVIFGAGASYDSASDYPPPVPDRDPRVAYRSKTGHEQFRPPLANELFENREMFRSVLQRFPECKALVTRLHHPSPSVEEQLEQIQGDAEEYPVYYQRLAAVRFYLRDVIRSTEEGWESIHKNITNHLTLFDVIERWRRTHEERVVIVTFNYDRMIETALAEFQIPCRTLDDYIRDDRYKLIKVHGSIDWARPVGHITTATRHDHVVGHMIADAQHLNLAAPIEVISNWNVPNSKEGANKEVIGLFPAIAIPVVQKQKFECPDTHLEALRNAIRTVTKILTIGWRGMERHFLEELKKHRLNVPRDLKVIGSGHEDSTEIAQRLFRAGITRDWYPSESGFSNVIRSREIETFLAL